MDTNATFPFSGTQTATATQYEGPPIGTYSDTASTSYDFSLTGNKRTFHTALSDYLPALNAGRTPGASHSQTIHITTTEPFFYTVAGHYNTTWIAPCSTMDLVAAIGGSVFSYYSSSQHINFICQPNQGQSLALDLVNGVTGGSASGMIPPGSYTLNFSASILQATTATADSIESGEVTFTFTPVNEPTVTTLTSAVILPSGAFQFNFTNTPGASFSVLATTNTSLPLSNWTVLGGVMEVSPGQFQFTDYQATNSPSHCLYYRLRSP